MSRILDPENGFFRFMGKVADVLILNFIFVISCLPVVTIGASYTAMYYYCTKAVANEEGYVWKSFLKSFKLNFVQGFVMELVFAIAAFILYTDIKYLYNAAFTGGGIIWRILFFVVIGMAVLVIMTFIYAFPLLSRFENRTFRILKNALFMSLRHLSTTVPLLLIFGIAAIIGWLFFPISLLFIAGAWVYVSSILLYKVLDRYMPKDERFEDDYYLGGDGVGQETAAPEDAESAEQ